MNPQLTHLNELRKKRPLRRLMKPVRIDEHVIDFRDRVAGYFGPISSSFTLAWLAKHRGRLHMFAIGGHRLTLLLVYDSKGRREPVPHLASDTRAIRTLVYGSEDE